MSRTNSGPCTVILDNRVHRVIRLGKNISSQQGYTVKLSHETDLATNTPADFMNISNGGGTTKVRCSGTFIPPNTGRSIASISDANRQVEVSLFPEQDRVVVLGSDISGEKAYQLTLSGATSTVSTMGSDVLTFVFEGLPIPIPAGGGGNKIPPNVGED